MTVAPLAALATLAQRQGSARLIPMPGDPTAWSSVSVWLGNAYKRVTRDDETGAVILATATGPVPAEPGDWIIKTMDGELHRGRGDDL